MNDEVILENFAKRFSELVSSSGTDVNKLCSIIGIKSNSTIYRYMNGQMTPKISTIKYLAEYYYVNPLWLMGYDVPKNARQSRTTNVISVPVFGIIPAGIPINCIQELLDTEEMSADEVTSDKEYFGLKIKGDSMYPEYLDGDVIILEQVSDCDSGQDCVVMVNGDDGTFKRVIKSADGIMLKPLNSRYDPMFYSNKQIEELPVRIIGRVIELRRKK